MSKGRPMNSDITLTLPDGARLTVASGTSGGVVVRSISEGLLRRALAVEVDGEVQDLVTPLRTGGSFRVLTANDEKALEVLRHSTAHVLATAVRRLRPDAKIGFGPAIDDGFYYDFEVEEPFTPADLEAFEGEMRRVCQEASAFVREEVSLPEARSRMADDPLKLERMADFDGDDVISTYTNGTFTDLCRGPHVPDTSHVRHFRLLSTAGAYWRGDSQRQMLQRIYGTAWFRAKDLRVHLNRLEEAKRRDHRLLGKRLDLFEFHQSAPGAAFWTPRGTVLYNTLLKFERELQERDFLEVKTPLMYDKSLWETSGHWGKYRDDMFMILNDGSGEHDASLKPMNCPSHYLLYRSKLRSYRDLPLRYVTFDVLHRNEVTGALSGLTRVRQFQQDDCHCFVTEEQIPGEVAFLAGFIVRFYAAFGLEARIRFATRPDLRIGTDALWDRAEGGLLAALEEIGLPFEVEVGDGAFYGPKIDFAIKDAIGREWQCGTIQLDYVAPDRFELEYAGSDNRMHCPVVIHRAVAGSLERFIAILIEHFAGDFPLWLAPEQVRVILIGTDAGEAAAVVAQQMTEAGLRVGLHPRAAEVDFREEIKDASQLKVPYMAIVGRREARDGTVSLRARGAKKRQVTLPVEEAVGRLRRESQRRELWGVAGTMERQ